MPAEELRTGTEMPRQANRATTMKTRRPPDEAALIVSNAFAAHPRDQLGPPYSRWRTGATGFAYGLVSTRSSLGS